MVFSSIDFVLFFLSLISLFKLIRNVFIKRSILLFSSIFFYSYWDIRLLPLLLFLTIFNFVIGTHLEKSETWRKNYLIIGIVVNLLILCYFKYTNFFIDSFNKSFVGLNIHLSSFQIILPLGISFFIFEFISYLADIYHGKIKHTDNLLDFSNFVFFFPRLASGPIIRPADILPQLHKEIVISRKNVIIGVQIFTLGLFKKVVIADRVAPFVDSVFAVPEIFGYQTLILAVLSYSLQIYCDFSGYSDMAIGVSKIMGFDLPVNFNMPYISRSITEFWQRWHISLSSWLRDYLYFPLGGNRKGEGRTKINLMVVMLLGGLWHGANWTFVAWGALQGFGLIFQKIFSSYDFIKTQNTLYNRTFSFLSWLLTFLFVCLSWIIFRSDTFGKSSIFITRILFLESGVEFYFIYSIIYIIAVFFISYIISRRNFEKKEYTLFDLSRFRNQMLFIFILTFILFMGAENSSPFIYFQF